jgi:Mg2+ and Co2+ transporter CorA
MNANWYLIATGKLQAQSAPIDWTKPIQDAHAEYWVDIDRGEPGELREFLGPLRLHPLLLDRCLDQAISPGVLVYGNSVLMEYPAALNRETAETAYLTILLQTPYLITVRHGPMPVLDDLIVALSAEHAEAHHLAQIVYQILDEFTDLNVHAQTDIRDQLLGMAKTLADNPASFDAGNLAHVRWQVENLISLVENQLYCASSLAALDLKDLQEPHRKAYIQDLLAEAEIAQRAAYRLESRLNDLYSDYQMMGSDRVERRLRLLTIVSAVTLPLGLIAGLLGMNVGGVPGIDNPSGFVTVMASMVVIAIAMFIYFKQKGWLD